MHIGCCENCRYVDLLEYLTSGCPRCGGRMAPLGVSSAEWNNMSMRQRAAVIADRFPDENAPYPADDDPAPVPSETEKNTETVQNVPEPPAAPAAPPVRSRGETGYVYICYKCSTIAGHDGKRDKYFCPECGSDMVEAGCTAADWAGMTKEQKRNVAEEAKIRHMVSAIKKASIDDGDSERTQNIINVV